MEPFDKEDKVPDFFAKRAEVRSQDDEDESLDAAKDRLDFGTEEDVELSMDTDEVPYDFRAEYKERIGRTFAEEGDDEVEKRFFSIRMHAIGIGVLIGVLVALLVSVFLFGGAEDEDMSGDAIVVSESKRPVKVRPTNPGGMEIPDQDKTIYKRLRTDKVDTNVERLEIAEEEPVRPQVPTREGQILGTPRVIPSADEMELEVLSIQDKAVQAPIAKSEPVREPEAAPVKTASVVTPVKTKATPVKVTSAAKTTTSKDVWRVQLISLPSKTGAEKAWPKILKAHSALLSGLTHDVVEVKIKGKGTFYRLRVGAFKDRGSAKNLCDKLKVRKQDCTLTK